MTDENRGDMGTFRLTIDINRPAADVFAFVAEPRNMPLWSDAVSLSLRNRTQRRRKPAHPRRGHLERRTPRTIRPSRRRRDPSVQAGHATEPRGTEAPRRGECRVAA